MDLYSAKAVRLRAEMDEAHAAMVHAYIKQTEAEQMGQDVGALNPDGQVARVRATKEYLQALDRYRKALRAWADQVFRSDR